MGKSHSSTQQLRGMAEEKDTVMLLASGVFCLPMAESLDGNSGQWTNLKAQSVP